MGMFFAYFACQAFELLQIAIAIAPVAHGLFHQAGVAKLVQQPDHAFDIIGVDATLQSGSLCAIQIRWDFFQCLQDRAVTSGNFQGRPEFFQVRRVGAVHITVQVVDGIFLRLGPQAFADQYAAKA